MEGNIMVERSIYNKARRVKAWFNIKNMDNAVALVEYYPNYSYEDYYSLFEPFHTWDIDSIIDKILCSNPGLTNIHINNPKNIP